MKVELDEFLPMYSPIRVTFSSTPEKSLSLLSHLYSSDPGNYYSHFYHHRLVLPALELYLYNGSLQYVYTVVFVFEFF